MLFHENRLLADDSHEIAYLFFLLGKMSQNFHLLQSQNLSSAAIVVGTLRVNYCYMYKVKHILKL